MVVVEVVMDNLTLVLVEMVVEVVVDLLSKELVVTALITDLQQVIPIQVFAESPLHKERLVVLLH